MTLYRDTGKSRMYVSSGWTLKDGDQATLVGNGRNKFPSVMSPERECKIEHTFADLDLVGVDAIGQPNLYAILPGGSFQYSHWELRRYVLLGYTAETD